jgi:hypothetical protein
MFYGNIPRVSCAEEKSPHTLVVNKLCEAILRGQNLWTTAFVPSSALVFGSKLIHRWIVYLTKEHITIPSGGLQDRKEISVFFYIVPDNDDYDGDKPITLIFVHTMEELFVS